MSLNRIPASARRCLSRARRLLVALIVTALTLGLAPLPSEAAPSRPALTRALAYGPSAAQLLDIHRPATPGPHPVLVYLHAGGWVAGARTGIPDLVLDQLQRGWAVVSVDYRLAPGASAETMLGDVKRAVRFVKANAASLGLDPARVVLSGASAGGHLAALAAVTPGQFEPAGLPAALAAVDSKVAGVVALVPPVDLVDVHRTGDFGQAIVESLLGCRPVAGPNACPPGRVAAFTPATHLDPSDPPAYLAFGQLDGLCRPATGKVLADRWRAVRGGGVSLEVAAGQGHNLTSLSKLNGFLDSLARPPRVPYFTDLPPASYFAPGVRWLAAKGVTTGVAPGRFAPDEAVTRAQMVTFLWRMMGSPKVAAPHGFADVPTGAYFEPAVRWAVQARVTTGVAPGRFAPAALVSRAQTVTFLHRVAGSGRASAGSFADVPTGAYFEPAVRWAVQHRITTGVAPTRFAPTEAVTRAQMAAFLHRSVLAPEAWAGPLPPTAP